MSHCISSCFMPSPPQRLAWCWVWKGRCQPGWSHREKLTVLLASLTAEKDRWIERDSQRISRASGQLSRIDWLDRRVGLRFVPLRPECTQLVGEYHLWTSVKCVRLSHTWRKKRVNPSVVECWQISWCIHITKWLVWCSRSALRQSRQQSFPYPFCLFSLVWF